MTAMPITSKQRKQYYRFVEDAAEQALVEQGLGKEDLQELFTKGGEFQKHLKEGIRKYSTRGPVFPIYLETEVGGKSKDELLAELSAAGIEVSDWAKDIMSKPAWKPGPKERVKFARVKVKDLGFTENPTTSQIWTRILELGYALCEPGDGPAIRRDLKDQPTGDVCWLAMNQITDSGGRPRVFKLERDVRGKRWLRAYWTLPGDQWLLGSEIVFRLRK